MPKQGPSGPCHANIRDPKGSGNIAGVVRVSHWSVPTLDQRRRAAPMMNMTWEHRAASSCTSAGHISGHGEIVAHPHPPLEHELHDGRDFCYSLLGPQQLGRQWTQLSAHTHVSDK